MRCHPPPRSMAACSSPIPPASTPPSSASAWRAASAPPATPIGTRPARPGNLAVDQRPAAVAIPATAADVVAIVEFVRERGLLVTAQGTGHNAGAYDTLADTILVKTHGLRGVEIDAEARIARCQAGTLWAEVTQPASELGLAPLAGSSPDVGVVGYVLGGGLSWLARKHGVGRRHGVHELRRGHGRPGGVLLGRRLRPPAPRQGRGRPRGPLPRKPRNLRELIAGEARRSSVSVL